MKKLSILIAFTVLALNVMAQTAFSVSHSHDIPANQPSSLSVASLRNPWIGGGLVYNIRDDVSDFFRLNARAQYAPIKGENFEIPFVTNADLTGDTLAADQGVDIGIFPWVSIDNATGFSLLLHGGLNYTFTTADPDGDLFTVMAGLEMAIWGKDENQAPFTLSAAPVLVFRTGAEPQNTAGLEITGVLPIANGLGFLIQGTIPFDNVNYFTKGIKAGIIANGLLRS